ncbi:MAG: DUF1616 domain-containing protein [Halobacteriaceae archaeon]
MERAVLAVATSVVIGIGLGTALALLPGGLAAVPALAALSVVIGTGLGWALRRDRRQREAPWLSGAAGLSDWRPSPQAAAGRPATTAVLVLLVVGATLGAGSVVALGLVHDPAGFTEFGAVPAGAGAANLSSGEYREAVVDGSGLTLRVTNHYDRSIRYRLVVLVQVVTAENGTVTIRSERRRLVRSRLVRPGETWRLRHDPSLSTENRSVRLVYRLTRGPDESLVGQLHLWLNGTARQAQRPPGSVEGGRLPTAATRGRH